MEEKQEEKGREKRAGDRDNLCAHLEVGVKGGERLIRVPVRRKNPRGCRTRSARRRWLWGERGRLGNEELPTAGFATAGASLPMPARTATLAPLCLAHMPSPRSPSPLLSARSVRRILGLRLWPSDAPSADGAGQASSRSAEPSSADAPPAASTAPSSASRPKPWGCSVTSLGYDVLCVSQFTLYARYSGTKPDFSKAMKSDEARAAYEGFLEAMRRGYPGGKVLDGVFGAMMDVALVNDGPVTITIDSANPGNALEHGTQ